MADMSANKPPFVGDSEEVVDAHGILFSPEEDKEEDVDQEDGDDGMKSLRFSLVRHWINILLQPSRSRLRASLKGATMDQSFLPPI